MTNSFKSFKDFENWLAKEFGGEKFHPGLERLYKVFEKDLPFIQRSKAKIITVAGTNGKGETIHFLKEILKYKAKSFLAFTSPHILSIDERFSSNKGNISLKELNDCHQLLVKSRKSLTYYEYLFGIFLIWSKSQKIDYLLLEVGLGGRLDAVNLLNADLVLLTSISRDHQEFLGNRLQDILKEKYGVTRPGKKLISNLESRYLSNLLREWCDRDQVEFKHLPQGQESFSRRNYLLATNAFEGRDCPKYDKIQPRMMIGKYDGSNATFYGAHNVDGIRKLVQKLRYKTYNFHTTLLAFSKRSERELITMIKILKSCSVTQNIVLTDFSHIRANPVKGLAEEFDLPYKEDWRTYLKEHKQCEILVTGSYYFLSEALDYIQRDLSYQSYPSSTQEKSTF